MHTQPPPSAVKRERKRREQDLRQQQAQREAIRGLTMGARDRSYLVRDGEIDVLRNVYGGVEVRSCPLQLRWNIAFQTILPCRLSAFSLQRLIA